MVRAAILAALLPNLNQMAVIGLVSIPGNVIAIVSKNISIHTFGMVVNICCRHDDGTAAGRSVSTRRCGVSNGYYLVMTSIFNS